MPLYTPGITRNSRCSRSCRRAPGGISEAIREKIRAFWAPFWVLKTVLEFIRRKTEKNNENEAQLAAIDTRPQGPRARVYIQTPRRLAAPRLQKAVYFRLFSFIFVYFELENNIIIIFAFSNCKNCSRTQQQRLSCTQSVEPTEHAELMRNSRLDSKDFFKFKLKWIFKMQIKSFLFNLAFGKSRNESRKRRTSGPLPTRGVRTPHDPKLHGVWNATFRLSFNSKLILFFLKMLRLSQFSRWGLKGGEFGFFSGV